MKILHKYVLKEHLGPLIFALTALTSLLLLQYIAKRFGELLGKGLPWYVIVEFLTLSLPLTIALSLPMAVLVATLYAFSRLAAENEITAMKAGGASLSNVLMPVLWAAAGVTVFMVGFNDQVLPRANHRLRTLQGDIAQKKPTFGMREQVINEVSPGKLYLRAGRLEQTSNVMREVTIYDLGDPTRRRTIYADSGNMTMSANQSDLLLTLYSGTVQDVPTATPETLQRLYFTTQLIRVRDVGNAFQKTTHDTYKGEREMSVCEMERNAVKARQEFASAQKDFRYSLTLARSRKVKLSREVLETPTSMPLSLGLGHAYCGMLARIGVKALLAQEPAQKPAAPAPRSAAPSSGTMPDPGVIPSEVVAAQMESVRLRVLEAVRNLNRYEVEIHKKFALAAACFVFVLLGAPLALRFPLGGVGLTIGVSLVVFGLYYVGLIGGEALAKRGMVPPVVSMWIANFVFGLLALVLLARTARKSGSNRGGDMHEMLATFTPRFMRRLRAAAAPRPGAS